ncbi:MAG: hypothetical protein M3O67_07830, partial [Bacteroidota bacterium]|nr:hypothetical protein [Bacteroidota bacterium]
MKKKILLMLLVSFSVALTYAQKKAKKITAYAITAPQKGESGWAEVRLVDIVTGEELKTIYQSKQQIEILNARTGKPVVKKEIKFNTIPAKKVVNLDFELEKKEPVSNTQVYTVNQDKNLQPLKIDANVNVESVKRDGSKNLIITKENTNNLNVQTDKPFATNSAACAYDKKHDRLYYTPMGINQLRYIDLNSKNPRIYYFEDEPFGALSGPRDIPNQITRMVIASDGDGYALTNNGNHLIRFTTNKKAAITDLGALTDDAKNASFSIHSPGGYGGDMIADASANLYLIAANRAVFKIDLQSKVATYKGSIKGLPKSYTTNGAIVEEETTIIVSSANSTSGYYKFDINTLQAEKISNSESV